MAKIFNASSEKKALKSGLVVALGAGAVLAGQAVQNDNVTTAHAAKKGGGHSASHSAPAKSSGSHKSSGSTAHKSSGASHAKSSGKKSSGNSMQNAINQMHHAYSKDHIKNGRTGNGGAHQVDRNHHGKVTSTTDRHKDAEGNTVSTITNKNKARHLRNGKNKETWVSHYNDSSKSFNKNWDGKHPGQTGFQDKNGKPHYFKNPKNGQTTTDPTGQKWVYEADKGHWQHAGSPTAPSNTPAPSTDIGDSTPTPSIPDSTPTPSPAPDNGTPTANTPAPAPSEGSHDKNTKQGTQTYVFVDKNTNQQVGNPTKVGGDVGKDVPVSLKTPDGYKLADGQKVPTSANIKDQDNPIKIYVVKDANPDRKDGTQTLRFVDEKTGKEVGSPVKLNGKVGDKLTPDMKVPDGWKLAKGEKIPTSVDIKDTDTPIDIKVTKDDTKKPATQTYQFVDKNGHKIVGTAKVNGQVGDHVPLDLKIPKGYHLVPGQKLPTVADLKATDKPIQILVEKDKGDGSATADAGLNKKNNNGNGNNGAGNNGNGNGAGNNGGNGVASLPQTGNSSSNAAMLAGGAMVAAMATLGIAHSRKRKA